MKGISPLIASVVLIAITLAIAGILTTYALQFVSSRTTAITHEAECLGSLEVESVSFDNGTLSFLLWNRVNFSLSDFIVSVVYAETELKSFSLKDCCNLTTIPAHMGSSVRIATGSTAKPVRAEIISGTCPKYRVPISIP